MKQALILISVFYFSLTSCSRFHKKRYVEENFSFETSGCLNKCKHYSFILVKEIDTLLYTFYTGYANVELTGNYSRRLSDKEKKKLWKLIHKAQLLKMKDEYDYGAEDSQQRIIFYRYGESEKQIRFGHDVPEILKQIEAEIEKIIAAPGWKKADK